MGLAGTSQAATISQASWTANNWGLYMDVYGASQTNGWSFTYWLFQCSDSAPGTLKYPCTITYTLNGVQATENIWVNNDCYPNNQGCNIYGNGTINNCVATDANSQQPNGWWSDGPLLYYLYPNPTLSTPGKASTSLDGGNSYATLDVGTCLTYRLNAGGTLYASVIYPR